jgi:hypothetical protein
MIKDYSQHFRAMASGCRWFAAVLLLAFLPLARGQAAPESELGGQGILFRLRLAGGEG